MMFGISFLWALYIFVILKVHIIRGQSCDPDFTKPFNCSANAECNLETRQCQCKLGYILKNSTCVVDNQHTLSNVTPNTSSLVDKQSSGHIVAGILIPLFFLISIVSAIYIGRKYKVIPWLRSKFQQRTNNYDEFIIGQDLDDDDPPLR